MSELLTSSPLLYSLSLTLLHFVWQGCLIALLLKAILLVVDPNKPTIRYAWSALATLANFIVPCITFLLVYQPEYGNTLQAVNFSNLMSSLINTSYDYEQNSLIELLEWLPYLSLSWLIGVSYLAAKLLIEFYLVNQLPKKQIIAPSEQLSAVFAALISKMQMTQKPQLLLSLHATVPMAIGWIKPVILIPASMVTGLTDEQLEMLILHELAHVQRYDYVANLFQTLVELLFFFHPCVHWVSKQLRNEREYCSDDIAVKHCGNAIAYAHTLADTAMLCHKHNHRSHSIPSMAMAASGGDLKKRVVRLVNHHCTSKNHKSKWLAATIVLFSILIISSQHIITLTLLNDKMGTIPFISSSTITQKNLSYVVVNPIQKSSIANQLLKEKTTEKVLPDDPSAPMVHQIKPEVSDNVLSKIKTHPSLTSRVAPTKRVEKHATIKTNLTKHQSNSENTKSTLPTTLLTTNSEKLSTHNNQINLIASNNSNDQSAETILDTSEKSSTIEQAFDRTDASLNGQFNNHYSKQIESLASQTPTNTHQSNYDLSKVTEIIEPKKDAFIQAQLLNSYEPKYPSMAKRKGIELEVTINFIIDENGRVSNIEFEDQSKVNYFRRTIRSAMAKWRFIPAKKNGQPVQSKMSKIFSFSLIS